MHNQPLRGAGAHLTLQGQVFAEPTNLMGQEGWQPLPLLLLLHRCAVLEKLDIINKAKKKFC